MDLLLPFGLEYIFFFPHLLSKSMEIRMCMTVNLPVVLYGCETWSVTLSEEHRVKVFKNRVLSKTFGVRE